MMTMRSMRTAALVAALIMTSGAGAADQQAFPTRPVRLVISNVPGAAPDVIGRLVAAKLTELWGQQVVIDNRPGATGLIAAETVARAAPDGYTVWLNTMTQLISTLQAKRHMLATDFVPITLVASTPFVIVVGPAMPVKTIAEYIAYAKARPGKLVYGSAGQWGSSHLCMESLNAITGVSMMHVPYKGSTLVLNDLIGERIHAYCSAAPSLSTFAQTGKVRSIGITYLKPSRLVPGVPAVAETVPGFELLGWYGLQAPLTMPRHLVSKWNSDIVKVLRMPDLQERIVAVGAEAVGTTPQEFGTFLKKETQRWDKVLREGGTFPAHKE